MSDDRQIHQVLEFITVGAYNCLYREEILTMDQLLECTEADLLAIPSLGAGKLAVIVHELAQHGLALASEGPPRNRVEQLADIALRKAHKKHWTLLVKEIRASEEAALVRQAFVSEPDVEKEA